MTAEETPDYPWSPSRPRGKWNAKKTAVAVAAALLAAAAVGAVIFYWRLPEVTALINADPATTALMTQRMQAARNEGRELRIRQRWVPLAAIPRLLIDTVRISEDAAFYQHQGIDMFELKDAIRQSWREKRLVRGASTITQQLAKNLYLTTDRSLLRKLKEYFIAKRLEAALTKNRIMHLYLNVIELGPGIFGVEAAAQTYFGKPVGALTLEEMVRLVSIIPRPLTVDPLKSGNWLNWRARWILDTLARYELISAATRAELIPTFSSGQ